MSYITYPHSLRHDADLPLTWDGPAMRATGSILRIVGGGCLFAAVAYLMIVLPDLIG